MLEDSYNGLHNFLYLYMADFNNVELMEIYELKNKLSDLACLERYTEGANILSSISKYIDTMIRKARQTTMYVTLNTSYPESLMYVIVLNAEIWMRPASLRQLARNLRITVCNITNRKVLNCVVSYLRYIPRGLQVR